MRIPKPITIAIAFLGFTIFALSLHALPPDATSSASKPALDTLAHANPAQIKSFFSSANYARLQRSDAEFIDDVYQAILRREPDANGRDAWLAALKNAPNPSAAREKLVETFLESSEYTAAHSKAGAPKTATLDNTRNPANAIFNKTGVFVNDATAFPVRLYKSRLKIGRVAWIALQIDNGGNVRTDSVAAIEKGWADQWRSAGFKVGFWGCPRGIGQHGNKASFDQAVPLVKSDAALAVRLAAKYHADLYITDPEDSYQSYNPTDPAPQLNRVFVEAFKTAAAAAGIARMPRALSSEGRIALDMKPWIDEGWDALPQAYWNSYAVYQPSKCVDFYMQTGWPIGRIHPTISTFTSEGEKRTVSLAEYDKDLKSRGTTGFSFYLPESYLRTDELYKELAKMAVK